MATWLQLCPSLSAAISKARLHAKIYYRASVDQTVCRKHSSVQENMSSQHNALVGQENLLGGKYCFDDFSGRKEQAEIAMGQQLPFFKESKMLSRSPSRLDGLIALLNLFPHRFGVVISVPGTVPASYHKSHHTKTCSAWCVKTKQRQHRCVQAHEALGGMVTWLKWPLGNVGEAGTVSCRGKTQRPLSKS